MILEQEDLMGMSVAGDDLSMGAEDPMAMTPAPVVNVDADKNTKDNGKFVVDQLPYAATTGNKTFVSIDLDRLEESIRHELEENDMNTTHLEEEYDLDSLEEDLLGEELDLIFEKEDEDSDEDSDENSDDDSDDDSDNAGTITEVDQSLVEAIKDILSEEMEEILEEEELTEADEDGDGAPAAPKWSQEPGKEAPKWADKDDEDPDVGDQLEESAEEMFEAYQTFEEGVQKESNNLKTKNNTLITEQKQLNGKVQLMKEKLQKYGTVIEKLQEKLNETNLANAKLLYQNRVLDSDSLNERQKDRIVETIMDAKTVEEAKIIYETLQSAVGANTFKRKPKSLNEVVTKRSSAFMPRKEEKRVDPFTARMKALAGIKE